MGIIHSLQRFSTQSWPPKSKFDVERDIPDLSGKVVIVTGERQHNFTTQYLKVNILDRWQYWYRQGDDQGIHWALNWRTAVTF